MNHLLRRRSALRVASTMLLSSLLLLPPPSHAQAGFTSRTGWGTYYHLFSADSPWNSRPVNPVFGTYELRKPVDNPTWIPTINDGGFSLGVFMASASDPAMTVYGKQGQVGVNDPDTGKFRDITLPHWPSTVTPASGGDGHADIVDTATGVLHSFYQLKKVDGKWTARMYSWSRIDGRGWGDAAHWSQGARASGVPSSAGLIRRQELSDGNPYYVHALAMSLPHQTLSNGISKSAYIFPATSADSSSVENSGQIPQGALLMLPASFNTAAIASAPLRKIAETLKRYGAYVIDRNYDSAYSIYVENGANFELMPNGWDLDVVADLEAIRAGLRQVLSADKWLDGDGKVKAKPVAEPENILSMRGNWLMPIGSAPGPGVYDTWKQAVVFPYTASKITQVNYANGLSKVLWSQPDAGEHMRFTSEAGGDATVRLQVKVAGALAFDSGYLANGASVAFPWPKAALGTLSVTLWAESGVNHPSWSRGILSKE